MVYFTVKDREQITYNSNSCEWENAEIAYAY